MPGRTVMAFFAAVAFTTACESTTENKISYKATLTGAQEVPPVTTSGSGTFNATFDEGSQILSYTLTFTGLTSNATLAHIHGPAASGVNADVLVNFSDVTGGRTITLGGTSGSGSGTINLTSTSVITATVSGDSLRKLLDSGNAYVNVHTATNGGGELRGQITRQ